MACRIQFLDRELSRFNWCRLDASGSIECGEADSSELRELSTKSSPIVIFLPQRDILMTRAMLPPRAGKQQLNAIAYAVEDQLGDDIDVNFFAVAAQQADHSVPVAVIERDIMDRLQRLLAEQHVQVRHILPQFYQCPLADDEEWLASVCPVEEGYLIRYGQHAGMVCGSALLAGILKLLKDRKDTGCRRVDFYADDIPSDLGSSDIEIRRFSRLDLLSGDMECANCINLKQQQYRSSHAWLGLARSWKWPLIAAMLVVVALLAESFIQFRGLQQEYRDLISQQQALLQKHVPDVAPGKRPKDQLIKLLSANRSLAQGTGFVDLLHQYSNLLVGVEGLATGKIMYQQSRLVVNIESGDLKAIEVLREKIAGIEISAGIEDINIKPGLTTARLILGGTP